MKQQTTAFSLPSEHRLKAYTVAATAAGVGALCSAPAAEAKVVYTTVHVKIVRNIGLVLFDVNHDGIADFGLSNTFVLTSRTHSFLRVAQLRQGNEIWGAYSSYSGSQVLCAAALPRGAKIGPKGQFQKDPSSGLPMAESNGRRAFGPWLNVKQAYLPRLRSSPAVSNGVVYVEDDDIIYAFGLN